jgi:hypothetical protein
VSAALARRFTFVVKVACAAELKGLLEPPIVFGDPTNKSTVTEALLTAADDPLSKTDRLLIVIALEPVVKTTPVFSEVPIPYPPKPERVGELLSSSSTAALAGPAARAARIEQEASRRFMTVRMVMD